MHTLKLASALAAGLLSAAAASATTVTLDFSGTSGYGAQVTDFYNGGFDIPSSSATPAASGTNYGISFAGSVLVLPQTDALGPYYSGNDGNGNAVNNAVFVNPGDLPTTPGFMNVTAGFDAFTVTYGAITGTTPTVLNFYSGLNGTGSLIGTLSLDSNSDACANGQVCLWSVSSATLGGAIAQSVDFSSNAGTVLFTNVSVNEVPLPASGLLMSFGVAGLALFGARRRAA